ncbi:RNA polymerase sigma factor SigE [Frankia sp. Cj5]|uniref:RNA polymerase sigma factor SigE n=1 Tax=Frankia sp. Cj5 TaxID=2880978 RepID=UPI001EF5A833|nr:RNA polymerase sigma factor SigE [Frankia sp. Cj5]
MNGQDTRLATFAPGRSVSSRPVSDGDAVAEPAAVEIAGADQPTWVPPTWEEVVRDHGNRVYRLAYRLTGNAHDAEDLTQDVFVRVFRSLADYTPGTFEGWLHRITTNLFLDRMRRQQKIRFDALPDDPERLAGREASPEAVYAESHLDADIEGALAALPPDFRAAVVLCDIEQLSYEEIAQTLGVKLGTVRSRISRGRAMLRQALADRAPRAAGTAAGPALFDASAAAGAALTAPAAPETAAGASSIGAGAALSVEDAASPSRRSHRITRRASPAGQPAVASAGGGTSSTPEGQA